MPFSKRLNQETTTHHLGKGKSPLNDQTIPFLRVYLRAYLMESTFANSHLINESTVDSIGDDPIMPWVELLDQIGRLKVDFKDLASVSIASYKEWDEMYLALLAL
jgi:hypothetical protein